MSSVCIIWAAWPVRSLHCSISNPEVSMAVRSRSGVVRWLYSGSVGPGHREVGFAVLAGDDVPER
jgi:hypothetical protein